MVSPRPSAGAPNFFETFSVKHENDADIPVEALEGPGLRKVYMSNPLEYQTGFNRSKPELSKEQIVDAMKFLIEDTDQIRTELANDLRESAKPDYSDAYMRGIIAGLVEAIEIVENGAAQ